MIQALVRFIFFVSIALVDAENRNQERAASFHSQALELVHHNNYDLALAHFRAACRSYNESALYWNDLGVTEMRMEQYDLARKRFQKALSIDPYFELAIQNMNDLEYFSPASSEQSVPSVGDARRHKIMHPRELTHAEFVQLNTAFTSYPHIDKDHHQMVKSVLSEPFIIKNAFSLFNITPSKLESVLNRHFLTTTYGHHRVDFYPQNMLLENAHPYFLSLGGALRQLLHTPEEVYVGVDASAPGTYVQWNLDCDMWHDVLDRLGASVPELFRDRWAEGCFGKGGRRVGGVGSGGESGTNKDNSSGSGVNKDGSSADSTGNVGTKYLQSADTAVDGHTTTTTTTATTTTTTLDTARLSHFYLTTHWQMLLLAESNAGMFLHQDTLRTASWQLQLVGRKKWHLCSDANTPYLYKAGDVDMFSVDYDRYPLVQRAGCYEVILNEGEMLYYPSDFWHQTVNLDTPSIAISSTLITPLNYELVKHVLLDQCYDHWAALYSVP